MAKYDATRINLPSSSSSSSGSRVVCVCVCVYAVRAHSGKAPQHNINQSVVCLAGRVVRSVESLKCSDIWYDTL